MAARAATSSVLLLGSCYGSFEVKQVQVKQVQRGSTPGQQTQQLPFAPSTPGAAAAPARRPRRRRPPSAARSPCAHAARLSAMPAHAVAASQFLGTSSSHGQHARRVRVLRTNQGRLHMRGGVMLGAVLARSIVPV